MTYYRNPLFFCLAIVIIGVIGLITYLVWDEPVEKKKITVYYEKPASWDVKDSKKEPSNISDNKNSAGNKENKSEPSIDESSPALKIGNPTNLPKLHIVDAMGEPVASGAIALAAKEYPFSKENSFSQRLP